MIYYPFDSRNPLYRSRIGAVSEGETVKFRILIHNEALVHDAFLCLRADESNQIREIKLEPREWLSDYRFYDAEISLTEGLYWYCFRYTSNYGEFFVTKTKTSLGIVTHGGDWWQQTVYAKDYETPGWLKGGVIYQIFPDRFNKSGKTYDNIPADRYIETQWDKTPEHRQFENDSEKCRLGNDYYGGDFKGIEEKLDYLESLGVTCIYLNPVFEAHSNHRYNTADYLRVDPSLGSEEDFESLITAAKKRGIAIILDGVFSHTGDDSIYFNKKCRYNSLGAANSWDSPYRSWYNFKEYPHSYDAWWDVPSLPETNENDLSFSQFITGENGVLRYWLKKGIRGWRLDVADELPDEFLDKIRLAVKAEDTENYILGEVWEDATNKISYNARRRFLRGKQLDSVMNYPFSLAIIDFLKGGKAQMLNGTVLDILENYPKCAVDLLMNHIGTHDTARILTRLGCDYEIKDRQVAATHLMTDAEKQKGFALLKLAAVLQFTLPGVPSVYYGDEAGLEGWGDPFCRRAYPWGKENRELIDHYKALGQIRKRYETFKDGEYLPILTEKNTFCFERRGKTKVLVAVNRGEEEAQITLSKEYMGAKRLLGVAPSGNTLILPPKAFAILEK